MRTQLLVAPVVLALLAGACGDDSEDPAAEITVDSNEGEDSGNDASKDIEAGSGDEGTGDAGDGADDDGEAVATDSGDTHAITSDEDFTCDGDAVEIDGDGLNVSLDGSCSSVSVTGNDNQVELQTSEATTLSGNDNHIEAAESVGTVSTSGSGNGVNAPNVAIG